LAFGGGGTAVDDRFTARLPDSGEWFDLWHTHVDWHGEGNARPELRRECIRSLFVAWRRIDTFAAGLGCPWQSWLLFDAVDSGQDAVYLHTPNPNRDNFPYRFEEATWGMSPPSWLVEFITGDLEVGQSEFKGQPLYWVRRRR
jgi:hypothetical protein